MILLGSRLTPQASSRLCGNHNLFRMGLKGLVTTLSKCFWLLAFLLRPLAAKRGGQGATGALDVLHKVLGYIGRAIQTRHCTRLACHDDNAGVLVHYSVVIVKGESRHAHVKG